MLNNYEYFITLADELNISRAAEKLFISHQCLSKYLKNIEKEYGVIFFERKPRLSLTYAGRVMLDSLREIQAAERNLDHQLEEIREGDTGNVRLGITEGRLRIMIPDLLEEFRAKYPKVLVSVTGAPSPEMLEDLKENKLDLVISNAMTVKESTLIVDVVLEEHLFLVISDELLKKHFGPDTERIKEDFRQNGAPLQQFTEVPFVMNYHGFCSRDILEEHLSSLGVQVPVIHEATQQDLHLIMAARDYAAAICLGMFIPNVWQLNETSPDGNKLEIFPIRGLNRTNPVGIMMQSGKYMPAYMKYFCSLIHKQCDYYRSIDHSYFTDPAVY